MPILNHIHCLSKITQPNTKLYSKNIRKVEAESGCVRGSDSPFPQSRRHSVILFVTLLTRSHAAPDTSANLRPFWKEGRPFSSSSLPLVLPFVAFVTPARGPALVACRKSTICRSGKTQERCDLLPTSKNS